MKKLAIALALVMTVGVQSAWAFTCPLRTWGDERKMSEDYGTKVTGMAVSGVHSLIEVPVEVVYHLYQEPKADFDNGLGILRGLAMGLARGGEKAVRGGVDIIGALIPDFHGIPDDTHHHMKG